MNRLPRWALWLLAFAMAACAPASELLRPTQRTADLRGPIHLSAQVPAAFADWREDTSVRPVLPDPQLQATVDATYSQVLARSYVDSRGHRVMLSVAYGNDQSSEATAVHRPEFCYRTQGFRVREAGLATVALGNGQLTAQRLIAEYGKRFEPITYWVTLDQTATLPGIGRKWTQIRLGLSGVIADGMLVRISTVGLSQAEAFSVHERFAADLHAALAPALRARYFGAQGNAGQTQVSWPPLGGGSGAARPRGPAAGSAGPPQASWSPSGGGSGAAGPRGHS